MKNEKIIKQEMPLVVLGAEVLLPGMRMHLELDGKETIAGVEQAMLMDDLIFLSLKKPDRSEVNDSDDLYQIGTIVKVERLTKVA